MVDKVLHYQMPFTTGGQTVNDRLTAAYHSLAGSQMAKIVCKATTEEPIGPKKKHLDYLLHCTHEPNVNIPQLANCLIERTSNTNWSVVYKSLISIHNLMCYGNERFSQYLASSNANFNLVNFLDKASVQGYDMSTHVRRYAKYITEKIYTYRIMAFDFCKVKRGKEDGMLRTMTADKLLKALPLLQGQVDALLEFQVTSNELINGVINSCFILLFRDLIRLFACYNDGIINLLEKYFDMNKKQCREALDLYKKFLLRMDKVSDFLKVAESVGIDRGEIPDLAKAPGSLLEALEQHLNALEGQKVGAVPSAGRVTSPVSGPSASTQSAIQKFTSTGFTEPKSGYVDPGILDESVKKKILEEEEQRLNMLKEQRMRELEFSSKKHSVDYSTENRSKPVLSGSPPTTSNDRRQQNQQNKAKASSIDDLLSLDVSLPTAASSSANPNTNPFLTGFGGYYQQQPDRAAGYSNGHAAFATDDTFARAFGNSQQRQGSESFGDLLTPQQSTTPTSDNNPFAAQASVSKKPTSLTADNKLVKGDLDSSLANLAENLSIGRGQENLRNKPVQWGPTKSGGAAASSSSMMTLSSSLGWSTSALPAPAFSPQATYGAYPPPVHNNWSVPSSMAAGVGVGYSNYGQQPRPAYGAYPAAGMAGVNGAGVNAASMAPNPGGAFYQPPRPTAQMSAQDPFGLL